MVRLGYEVFNLHSMCAAVSVLVGIESMQDLDQRSMLPLGVSRAVCKSMCPG